MENIYNFIINFNVVIILLYIIYLIKKISLNIIADNEVLEDKVLEDKVFDIIQEILQDKVSKNEILEYQALDDVFELVKEILQVSDNEILEDEVLGNKILVILILVHLTKKISNDKNNNLDISLYY